MFQRRGFLSKQTAWQIFGGAIYTDCAKIQKKQKKWFCTFLGIV